MKEETKKQFNKVYIITFVALSVVLIVVGVCIAVNIATTGAESALESVAEMDVKVRSEVQYLTDDEFIYGIKHIVPEGSGQDVAWVDVVSSVDTTLEDALGQQVYTEYIDNFGRPALYLIVPDTADLAVVTSELLNVDVFNKVHIMTAGMATGLIESEYIFAEGELTSLYTSHEVASVDEPATVTALISDLCSEYDLSTESFLYSGKELRIDVAQLSSADILCIFDYSYQVCLRDKLFLNLVVVSNETLCANAYVARDSMYETYYPNNDLAPLFRLTYYYKNNFFKNNLRSACELYI